MNTNTFFKILLILFAVYIIYEIIKKLLGGSWSIEQLIVALMILNIGWTALIQRQIYSHLGEHKGYRIGKQNKEELF